MTQKPDLDRLHTGVDNLDAILRGGVPSGSVTVVTGPPGTGKTTLVQQICFNVATPHFRALCFNTLSEPTAKTIRYLSQFSFFDPKKIDDGIHFVDLGAVLRSGGLKEASEQIMAEVRRLKPAVVVIDSFKVFEEFASSTEEFRRFGYALAVNLMAWEATVFLLGEYGASDYERNPLFSIIDGLWVLSEREEMGEHQRFFKVAKMRGTDHSRDEQPFLIGPDGVVMLSARHALRRHRVPTAGERERCRTGIGKLDEILGPGIPYGSAVLLSGVAGTGKTVLSLEILYRGALAGEKGIYFSFEETEERLRATAKGLGWDLEAQLARGMIEIVFIPQPEIRVEAHLFMIQERIAKIGARRVVIDSASVFLHQVQDPRVAREKIFHLCTVLQNAGAVGFLCTDVPYGANQVSRFGVEETVVDGIIILSSLQEGQERQRYLEVYKLRNTAHLVGRHNMVIGARGISLFPRYGADAGPIGPPPALRIDDRIPSGVPGLDRLVGGGLLRRSVTLIAGSAGTGKSTIGLQFALEGARKKERALYVSLEEGPEQLVASAEALGLPLRAVVEEGTVEFLYVTREHLRAGQFLSVLADRLEALRANRLVLDSATHMMTDRMSLEELRHVLYQLAVRFKTLDVTSLVTLESPPLVSSDVVTPQNLSPIADNLILLRYREAAGALLPTLTVVKTRGSAHDRRTHAVVIGKGGLKIQAAAGRSRAR